MRIHERHSFQDEVWLHADHRGGGEVPCRRAQCNRKISPTEHQRFMMRDDYWNWGDDQTRKVLDRSLKRYYRFRSVAGFNQRRRRLPESSALSMRRIFPMPQITA